MFLKMGIFEPQRSYEHGSHKKSVYTVSIVRDVRSLVRQLCAFRGRRQ